MLEYLNDTRLHTQVNGKNVLNFVEANPVTCLANFTLMLEKIALKNPVLNLNLEGVIYYRLLN